MSRTTEEIFRPKAKSHRSSTSPRKSASVPPPTTGPASSPPPRWPPQPTHTPQSCTAQGDQQSCRNQEGTSPAEILGHVGGQHGQVVNLFLGAWALRVVVLVRVEHAVLALCGHRLKPHNNQCPIISHVTLQADYKATWTIIEVKIVRCSQVIQTPLTDKHG